MLRIESNYVYTAMDTFQRRTFVRATWGQHSENGVLVGQNNKGSIMQNCIYKDIIRDFLDNYMNLSRKK